MSNRWQQIERLYHAALEREEAQRAAYLHGACAGDDALRQEVESLLAQENRAEHFLERPAMDVAAKMLTEKQSHSSLIGRELGTYKLVSLLGAGGMGEVYQAHDTKLGRDVAIKVLPAVFVHDVERLARFQREARMLAALNHPNIATIYGLEHSEDVHYLVMELVPGETLAERVSGGALKIEEALKLGTQIAEALEAAHERGVIHRDLKPANVKVTPEGRVKVLDFGLAKAFAGDIGLDLSNAPTITAMGTEEGKILGTPAYMSPEQARGKLLDKRTDIWAFGCVLYELLTGKEAFRGETLTDTLAAVLEREPDWQTLPAMAPPKIRDLLRRCLQKDPQRRLRDIGDARIEIEEALTPPARTEPGKQQDADSASDIAPLWRRLPPARRRREDLGRDSVRSRNEARWVGAVVIIAASLLAAGIGFWYRRPSEGQRSVTRLAIPLPTGQELAPVAFNTVAMSPDGMNLVYTARRQGVSQLYLRKLESGEAIPIPGTEGGKVPFFSPDGQWIGFFAGTKLKKVPVGGGVAITLCDSPASTGGSWGTDGRIYFAPQNISGISRVSADGGTPEPITTLDRQQGESSHLWPQLLPGGKAILFTIWTGPGIDESQLAVQLLGTNRHQVVVRGASGGGFYVSSGHLAYVRGGTLMTVPFDLAHLEVTADAPVEAVKGVMEGVVTAHFSVSSGGTLVYVPGPSAVATKTRLVWVDLSGEAEPLATPPRAYRNLRLSPDGRRVVIGALSSTGDIWIYDIARSTLTRFNSGAPSLFPLWTPDGIQVTYQMFRPGTRNLYRRPADGGGDEELLAASDNDMLPFSWSPDGRILAFQDQDPITGNDIWMVDISGDRKPRPFLKTPYDERFPEISPDGHWLAYVSDESGRFEIYVQPFPNPGQKWQISTDGGTLPTWSHNGSELFYTDLNGKKIIAVDVRTKPSFTAGLPHMLFEGNYFTWAGRTYDVSPDGKRFLMLQALGEQQSPTQINVVLNWFEELKQKVPTGKK